MDEHLWDVLQGHWGFGVGMSSNLFAHYRPSSLCRVECGIEEYVDGFLAIIVLLRFYPGSCMIEMRVADDRMSRLIR